jgi:hypothetical protein
MKIVRYISAQPAIPYYTWQVEVMITNFIEMGINPNHIDIVCWKQNGIIPEEWSKLANTYPVRFFFYDDTRETRHYISSIRPNILKQHFQQHPYIENDVIFYHDCDIIFTKPVKEWITEEMLNDDKWYGSDVRWYISYDYIKGKGEDVLDAMCSIMDIDKETVKEKQLNCIGAQYLLKGINYEFWNWVEMKSEILFKDITEMNNQKIKEDPKYHTLQIWCSDMWSVLWKGWLMGYETIAHPNFDFSWGTSSENDYTKMNIFHNAGVTSGSVGLFYKAKYMNTLPYNENLDIKEGTASRHYWEWIQKTGQSSCLI